MTNVDRRGRPETLKPGEDGSGIWGDDLQARHAWGPRRGGAGREFPPQSRDSVKSSRRRMRRRLGQLMLDLSGT